MPADGEAPALCARALSGDSAAQRQLSTLLWSTRGACRSLACAVAHEACGGGGAACELALCLLGRAAHDELACRVLAGLVRAPHVRCAVAGSDAENSMLHALVNVLEEGHSEQHKIFALYLHGVLTISEPSGATLFTPQNVAESVAWAVRAVSGQGGGGEGAAEQAVAELIGAVCARSEEMTAAVEAHFVAWPAGQADALVQRLATRPSGTDGGADGGRGGAGSVVCLLRVLSGCSRALARHVARAMARAGGAPGSPLSALVERLRSEASGMGQLGGGDRHDSCVGEEVELLVSSRPVPTRRRWFWARVLFLLWPACY
jgi:hypothetical protein